MNEDTTRNTHISVIATPGRAAMAYLGHDPEIPPPKADIETGRTASGEVYQECQIYIGSEMVAHMTISRGKAFAVQMVRAALKGAMPDEFPPDEAEEEAEDDPEKETEENPEEETGSADNSTDAENEIPSSGEENGPSGPDENDA